MPPLPLVVGIGRATIDLLGTVPHGLKLDARTELHQVSMQGGGATANALCAARALGCRARLAARVADDDFGRYVVRGLRESGVDCEFVSIVSAQLTPFAFSAVDRTGRATSCFTGGDVVAPTPSDLALPRLLDGAAALLVDGSNPETQVAAAELARSLGIKIVLDANALGEGTGELLALCDVLVASERFAAEVAPRGELEHALVELARLGPDTVVVTLGAAGAIGLFGDRLVKQEAYAVDIVDLTGAGDVFTGALTAALVMDEPPERAMQLAAAAAARSLERLGARAGLVGLDELRRFLGWPAA